MPLKEVLKVCDVDFSEKLRENLITAITLRFIKGYLQHQDTI